jgi:hypothetical protein
MKILMKISKGFKIKTKTIFNTFFVVESPEQAIAVIVAKEFC